MQARTHSPSQCNLQAVPGIMRIRFRNRFRIISTNNKINKFSQRHSLQELLGSLPVIIKMEFPRCNGFLCIALPTLQPTQSILLYFSYSTTNLEYPVFLRSSYPTTNLEYSVFFLFYCQGWIVFIFFKNNHFVMKTTTKNKTIVFKNDRFLMEIVLKNGRFQKQPFLKSQSFR